jgi:hypothetical protein
MEQIANTTALAACFYCCGGAICRLRHSRDAMRSVWIVLYVAIFALSAWTAADIVTYGVSIREALTVACIAVYFKVTSAVWTDTVPPIASTASTSRAT